MTLCLEDMLEILEVLLIVKMNGKHQVQWLTPEGENRRMVDSGQLGQKMFEIPAQPIKAGSSGMHLCSYTGSINRRITAQAAWT
jgi:hypothetical protein